MISFPIEQPTPYATAYPVVEDPPPPEGNGTATIPQAAPVVPVPVVPVVPVKPTAPNEEPDVIVSPEVGNSK